MVVDGGDTMVAVGGDTMVADGGDTTVADGGDIVVELLCWEVNVFSETDKTDSSEISIVC